MKYIITLVALCSLSFSYAQNINWNSLKENQDNIAYLNFGYDYGVTTQVGYARKISLFKPLLIKVDASFPMGANFADDFKLRIGGQMPLYNINSFLITASLQSVFRRHETEYVQMASFGSEMSTIIGYYKPKWHLAGEIGYDNSCVTHITHKAFMNEIYPEIKDGWYNQSGGNFFYGIQASRKIKNHMDVNLRTGATNARSTDENALLPFYFQIGVNFRFLSKTPS